MYPLRPVGLMDKASASGAGDSRFESWAGQMCITEQCHNKVAARLESIIVVPNTWTSLLYPAYARYCARMCGQMAAYMLPAFFDLGDRGAAFVCSCVIAIGGIDGQRRPLCDKTDSYLHRTLGNRFCDTYGRNQRKHAHTCDMRIHAPKPPSPSVA